MSESKRLLLGWGILLGGCFFLSLGFAGGWVFATCALTYFVLRYVLKPSLPSRWPIWFTGGYVLLVIALAIIPAWSAPLPPSFIGIFRTFQWLGAFFMLLYALVEHLYLGREKRRRHAA